MVELVDTRALGARASGREGSSPFIRTKVKRPLSGSFCFGMKKSWFFTATALAGANVKVRVAQKGNASVLVALSERRSEQSER